MALRDNINDKPDDSGEDKNKKDKTLDNSENGETPRKNLPIKSLPKR
jgi:hypothetical protein